MKRIFIALMLMAMACSTQAKFIGNYQTSDSLIFAVNTPIDSSGIEQTPDSMQRIVMINGVTTAGSSDVSSPFTGIKVTSSTYAGHINYEYRSLVSDISGAATGKRITIKIAAWVLGLPYYSEATFGVIGAPFQNVYAADWTTDSDLSGLATASALSTLSTTVGAVRDTVNAIIDTVQLQDNWCAKDATVVKTSNLPSNFSVLSITASTGFVSTGTNGVLVSSITDGIISAADFASGALNGKGDWTTDSDLSSIATSSALASVATDVGDILDTLQNQDNWIARQASLLTGDSVWSVAFNTAFPAGSIGDSLTNPSYMQGAAGLSASDIYNYFVSGSNEDQFKASVASLALASELAKALDSLGAALDSLGDMRSDIAAVPTATENGEQVYVSMTAGSREDDFKANIASLSTQDSIRVLCNKIDSLGAQLDTLRLVNFATKAAFGRHYLGSNADSTVYYWSGSRWLMNSFMHPNKDTAAFPDSTDVE